MKYFLLISFFQISYLITFAQPNILFIEADAQIIHTAGSGEHSKLQTPNIDQLVKEGVSFTAAYNMGSWSSEVNVASSTMLFYGKYLIESQEITQENTPVSLPEILKQNGYQTYMTGRWHANGKRPSELFDAIGGVENDQVETNPGEKINPLNNTVDAAVDLIKSTTVKNPFFLYVSLNSTKTSSIDETKKGNHQHNNVPATNLDNRIGDLIQSLKEKGIYEETIIVFMGRPGINLKENNLKENNPSENVSLHESSVTAPLIIKAPDLPENLKIADRIYLQDIFPTLLDLVDVKIPVHIQFESLVPLIHEIKAPRQSIYLSMPDDQRGIIYNHKKLIIYPKIGKKELFHLRNDPSEKINLMDDESFDSEGEVKKLMYQLSLWQRMVGDTVQVD